MIYRVKPDVSHNIRLLSSYGQVDTIFIIADTKKIRMWYTV